MLSIKDSTKLEFLREQEKNASVIIKRFKALDEQHTCDGKWILMEPFTVKAVVKNGTSVTHSNVPVSLIRLVDSIKVVRYDDEYLSAEEMKYISHGFTDKVINDYERILICLSHEYWHGRFDEADAPIISDIIRGHTYSDVLTVLLDIERLLNHVAGKVADHEYQVLAYEVHHCTREVGYLLHVLVKKIIFYAEMAVEKLADYPYGYGLGLEGAFRMESLLDVIRRL